METEEPLTYQFTSSETQATFQVESCASESARLDVNGDTRPLVKQSGVFF